MTKLVNVSQVVEPIKSAVVQAPGGEEKWADKVRRGFVGMLLIVLGIGIIALSVFKVDTDWVLLILCLVGVVLGIYGGNIIASDLTKNAGPLTVAFVKDITGAATRIVVRRKKEGGGMTLGQISDRRHLALEVWGKMLNQPYIWGGDDPIVGFDCSGFALEGLKAAGIVPRDLDTTAHNLLHVTFKARPRITDPKGMKPGCLIFWEGSQGIRHVEIVLLVLGNDIFTIGASGGGSKTPDPKAAAAQNAYIKVRPAAPGWFCAVDPFVGATP